MMGLFCPSVPCELHPKAHLYLQAGTSVYILTLAFVTSILPSGFGEIAAIVGVIGCVTTVERTALHQGQRWLAWPRNEDPACSGWQCHRDYKLSSTLSSICTSAWSGPQSIASFPDTASPTLRRYVPMDLVLPLLLYNSARRPRWPRRSAHIAGSIIAVVVGVSPLQVGMHVRLCGPVGSTWPTSR